MIKFERDNLVKIGVIILLFISFFIGFQEKHHFVKSLYSVLQIVAVLFMLISERMINRNQHILPIMALICIIIILGNRNARIAHGSLAIDTRICTAFIVYFLIYRKTYWYNTLIKALLVLGIFFGVTTIYLYFFPGAYSRFVYPLFGQDNTIEGTIQRGYAVGFSRHFSTTAIYHAVTLGIPICIVIKKEYIERRQRLFYAILIVALYIGILLTGKRAHSIFIPISVIACYYLFRPGEKISTTVKVIGGILLFIGVLYICIQFIPSLNNVLIRFQNKIEHGDITSGRSVMLEECKLLFMNNPIFGSGWGSFHYYTATGVQNAHNVYAQLIAENGVLFAIPFLVFIIGSIWHTSKAIHAIVEGKKQLSTDVFICLVYSFYIQVFFVLYCFTGNPLYDFQFIFPYMLGCAIGENTYRVYVISNHAISKTRKWKTIRQDYDEMLT